MTPVGCGGKEIGGGFKRLDFTSTMEMSLALALDPGILKFNRVKCEEQGLPMNLKPDEVYLRRETEDESIQQKIERKIDLLTASESVEGVGAWLELLRDREEWIAAPQWAQERAINAVSERIGPTFSFVGTQVYACAEQSHLMAQFEHGVSGVRLNLLPGGRLLRRAPNHFQEMPVQQVHLRPFLMAVTPVTQAEWDRIGGLDQRKWRGPNRPIETVSWNDGEAWLKKTGDGLRL
jgi:formylglycine-generating enzyme required for sulfatase activity